MAMAEPVIAITPIDDEELLYRAVRSGEIVRTAQGKVEVKAEAFSDRKNRPSVDRAQMRNFDPCLTRDSFGFDRGVIMLYAHQVRSISPLDDFDASGATIRGPQVDVEHKPLPDNLAHAEIFGQPHIEKKSLFRRLRVALSRLAEEHSERILWPVQ